MTRQESKAPSCHLLGRYVITETIASGGMASIHLGRLVGAEGFVRTVAIKRLLPALAEKADYSTMFLDEARIAGRIQHPNVAQTLDAVSEQGEFFIVMEYVHGETLVYFLKKMKDGGRRIPLGVVGAVFSGMLQGLHAAHVATDEDGAPLGIIHRDVSPQNVMVGVDGIPRLLDFGVAKGEGRKHKTQEGQIKGKLMYMSPEQLRGRALTRGTDLFSAGALLWESLVGDALFSADDEVELLSKLLTQEMRPPSHLTAGVTPEMDAVVMKALDRDPRARFHSAAEMAAAVEHAFPVATQREVGEWVAEVAAGRLSKQSRWMAEISRVSSEVHQRRDGVGTELLGSAPGLSPAPLPLVELDTGHGGPRMHVPEAHVATTLRPVTKEDLVPTAPPGPNQDLTATAPPEGHAGVTTRGLRGRGGTVPIAAAQMGEIESIASALSGGAPVMPEVPDLELGLPPAPAPATTAKGTFMMFEEPVPAAPAPAPLESTPAPVPVAAPLPKPVVVATPVTRSHVGRVGMVDHSAHASRSRGKLKVPGMLFALAVLISAADVALTRTTGIVLAFGPVRPSSVAGVFAVLALVLAVVALVRPTSER